MNIIFHVSRWKAVVVLVWMWGVALAQQPSPSRPTLLLVDRETHEGVVNAVVQTDVQTRFVTDAEGRCFIPLQALTGDSILISCVGYEPHRISKQDFLNRQPHRLLLTPRVGALDEVVVTERKRPTSASTVSETVDREQLRRGLGTNLASSLEQVKGVSTLQSGVTIAKPVIHGMYGNRILLVNNGVRQQGQQWGDDHAPEVDLNNAESVQVIKGAQAVRYGAEALGGIIRLDAKPLPYGSSSVMGSVSALYGSNGHRYASTGYVEGSLSHLPGWAWRVQGTHINGGDRSTGAYVLNNTAMRETDFSVSTGYRGERWRLEAFYSRFHTRLGVLYNAQTGNVDLMKERIAIGRPVDVYPFSRRIDYPYQRVNHHIARVEGSYSLPGVGTFTAAHAFQRDHRDEYHLRRNDHSKVPSLSLDLRSSQTDLGWNLSYARHWRTELGLFHAYANNRNRPGTGVVPVIPNYTQNNAGVYAIQQFTQERWGMEGGLRYDYQRLQAAGIDVYGKSYGGKHRFTNVTYMLGGHWRPTERLRLVSNLGMAWRAPHVYELYSLGLDHASGVYMQGNAAMKSEQSTKWVTTLSGTHRHLEWAVEGYLQWISGYIYDEPTQAFMTVLSGTYPVFAYRQVDALFQGIDAELTWKPFTGFDYALKGGMIWAQERATGRFLPYIPSFRVDQRMSYSFPLRQGWGDVLVAVSHRYVARQDRFDPATDLSATPPPAYGLWGGEIGWSRWLKGGQKLHLSLDASNLFNTLYKEYTNRFRYYAHDAGRDIRVLVTWDF